VPTPSAPNGDAPRLSNVKERCERAARAWEEIADRQSAIQQLT